MNAEESSAANRDREGNAKQAGIHHHLRMVSTPTVPPWRRWLVLGLTGSGVGLIAWSFFRDWWSIIMYAPQYPHGLKLNIALTGMHGDYREINTINHYIGMTNLDDAATTERAFAAHGVAAVALLVLVMVLFGGRKLGWFTAVPALVFPAAFVADAYFWMYRFGHTLDPHAPLNIPSFTPQLFGNGDIGQFKTFAVPAIGFWLALGGAFIVAIATWIRQRAVCAQCSRRGVCGAVCASGFVREIPPEKA